MNWDAIGAFADPQLNDIYPRGIADLGALSTDEYFRFSNMSLKTFWDKCSIEHFIG